jgi:PilZ domain
MAEEIDEGVAYLRALKQSVSPLAAAAAAPARETGAEPHPGTPDSVANPGEQFKGAEKRRSPRYQCEGSVDMREEGCDVRTWATFSDISLHGCYVEAQATYPVGTLLHMKLDAGGVRVETKGNVRVSYPYLGMGIAFAEISDENRARLRELLAKVSRPSMIMGPGIASTLPSCTPLAAAPTIGDPAAAVQALTEFFESRQMLMRDDFVRILRKSQSTDTKK